MDQKILDKYISGICSEKERRMVTEWISEEPKNIEEIIRLKKLNNLLLWNQPKELLAKGRTKRFKQVMRHTLKWAAILIIAFLGGLGTSWLLTPNEPIEMHTMIVPPGRSAQLILADGTKVYLNANSKLTFPTRFKKDARDVQLQGEGYFEVQSDSRRPFVVHTPAHQVKALGTTFNVCAYPDRNYFKASLLAGIIEVTDGNRVDRLSPNQEVIYSNNLYRKVEIENPDYFRWREGLICLDEESLIEVLDKLSLYFGCQIDIKDADLRNNSYRYSGKLRIRDGLEHVLRVLQQNVSFTYTIDDSYNQIEITR